MERARSVLKIGNSSYSISLPREWVVRNGIKPGQQLVVRESADGGLSILAKPKRSKLNASVDANLEMGMALRNIIGAYVSGANHIEVEGRNAGAVCELSRTKLAGVEIVEEREGALILEVFDNQYGRDSKAVFKRLFSLTQGMIGMAAQSCGQELDNSIEISKREAEIDRLYLLFLRNLASDSEGNHILEILAAKLLERLADNAEELGKNPKFLHKNRKLAELIDEAGICYRRAFEALMKSKAAESDFNYVKHFLEKVAAEDSRPEHQKAEIFAVYHALEKIGEYSRDLLEIAIDNYRTEEGIENKTPLK